MSRLLCTIGFTGKTAEEFFRLLSSAGVLQVVDVRLNRSGQLAGFSKHPDLTFFLKQITGIDYVHEPLLAPPKELLQSYRSAKDWPFYETAFLAEMNQRGVPAALDTSKWSSNIALLCSEPTPEKCHRRLVADILAAHWRHSGETVEIRHLVSAPAHPRKSPRKSAGKST
jgi:uncharacterized protein (DUF488 family)